MATHLHSLSRLHGSSEKRAPCNLSYTAYNTRYVYVYCAHSFYRTCPVILFIYRLVERCRRLRR